MKLALFRVNADAPHAVARIGVMHGEQLLDLTAFARGAAPASLRAMLADPVYGLSWARTQLARSEREPALAAAHTHALDAITFLPPIADADKFICVGKNYRTHLEELKRTNLIKEMPEEPTGFVKTNSCLTGHGADVVRPRDVTALDYEPELVFVIGKPAFRVPKNLPVADALDYVAGITLLNDLTCRDTQKREVASGSRFWTAKNAPGFGPLGPYLITMDEVADPYNIWVTCRVNGSERMRVNNSEQIWKISDILAHFSRLVPLQPGDMFSTGAPGGVAVGKANAAELFLKPGDVVECSFESPAMVLSNRIIADV
jgi:2-keto-4-pentenoate hydratase/2-oxohepta-3-ene-1,7-dioic acid hydratase in catechol pathway